MKIIENKPNKYIRFEDLTQGEIFKYENNYFLKIDSIQLNSLLYVNAVSLKYGRCTFFKSYDNIIPINATLTIDED